jgi:hypothetical protein
MKTMESESRSRLLRRKIGLVEHRMVETAERLWNHPQVRELYPEFLILVHSMIRASVPLLEAAAERARELPADDPTGPPLAEYFARHAREESRHDEWLLDDLEVLGVSREEVLARLPSTRVASLVGAFYYWVHHVHPVALLGYLAVLEGNPPKEEELEALRQRTGYPPEAFRTLVKHARLDIHHRDDLNQEIDRLELSPRLSSLLTVTCFHTVENVATAVEELLEAHAARHAA